MQIERLELSRNFSLDSKSNASTNYAISAFPSIYTFTPISNRLKNFFTFVKNKDIFYF